MGKRCKVLIEYLKTSGIRVGERDCPRPRVKVVKLLVDNLQNKIVKLPYGKKKGCGFSVIHLDTCSVRALEHR